MPVPTETLYNTRKVSLWFAASSVALLASLVWLIKVDYARPWRQFQNEYSELQAELAHFELLDLQTEASRNRLEAARARVVGEKEALAESQGHIESLIADLAEGGAEGRPGLMREILETIRGDRPEDWVARARHLDLPFGALLESQLEEADPEGLAAAIEPGSEYAARLEELLRWFHLRSLREYEMSIRGLYERRNIEQKNLNSEIGPAKVHFEHAKGLHGADAPETRAAEEALRKLEAEYARARQAFDDLADERRVIELQIRAIREGVDEAERVLALIEKEYVDAERKYADYSDKVKHGLFNLPLLDFAAPKGTPGRNEIKQVVLQDVRVDLNFVESYQTDRCITCHVAIDNKDFTRENLSRKLERAITAINEELERERKPVRLNVPVVEGREDLLPGRVTEGWLSLTPEQQNALFEALVTEINKYQRMHGRKELQFGEPLLAHPNLDLFVASDSPHPISAMGCTVCHEGNGEETDFVLAAHTPPSRETREQWKKKYYVRTAGLVPEQDFETAEHHWTRPMLTPNYSEASCTKCHQQATDIVSYNGEPAAPKINKGRFLYQQLGCIDCHLVEELEGSRRVGPDLAHVGEKLTRGFAQNWIFAPKDYRPSTNMPHYFLQENNDAGSVTDGGDTDPVLRTRAEVVAMTEYLFTLSTDYGPQTPPTELWEPLAEEGSDAAMAAADRGRRLFGEVGCLGCHSALSYAPDDPYDGGVGMPLGERWITDDLYRKLEDLVLDVKRGLLRKAKGRLIRDAVEDGRDPGGIDLSGADYISRTERMLSVSLEEGDGNHIPFGRIAEIFSEAHDGPAYDRIQARRSAYEAIVRAGPVELQHVELSAGEEELVSTTDDVYDAILDDAYERFEAMTYVDRVEYAMVNFDSARDAIFHPDTVSGPIFTRFAPELSSLLTKFEDRESAVFWLYDWLKDPRHYSSDTKMPRLRLKRGTFPVIDPETSEPTGEMVEADEALDIAVYLSALAANDTFSNEPFDSDDGRRRVLEEKRDELLLELLGALNSRTRAEAIIADEGGEMSRRLLAKLTGTMAEEDAAALIGGLDLNQKKWVFLGDRMIGHYGCYACHSIPGFENSARPGTELTNWGEKQLAQLDFAFFEPAFEKERNKDPLFRNLYPADRDYLTRWARTNPELEVDHTLASFAWHKMRNPRMWDRKKLKRPYEKLKMPNFYLTEEEAEALTTYLLSRKPARVSDNLRVDYKGTPTGMVARGRNHAWELNCVACHQIDGNVPVIDQFIQRLEGGEVVFDEVNAPPWLRGQGAKVRHDWFYAFLNDVIMLRPWLKVRMPSFHLDNEMSTTLVEYFVGLSQEESDWLAEQLTPVENYIARAREEADRTRLASSGMHRSPVGEGDDEAGGVNPDAEDGLGPGWRDWMTQQDLAGNAHLLADYAVRNRLVQPIALDPRSADQRAIAESLARVVADAQFLRDLYDVAYPFTEMPPSASDEESWKAHLADGETMFMTLECLACHVFGDPNVPGANSNPTAPNLLLTYERLRRDWVKAWLASPARIQPGTKMPNLFGQGYDSAFKDFPQEDRALLAERLFDDELLDDGQGQMTAITDWLYDAGKKHQDKVQVPLEAIPPAEERDLTKDSQMVAPLHGAVPPESVPGEESATDDEAPWPGEDDEAPWPGEEAEEADEAEGADAGESGAELEGWGDEETDSSPEGAEPEGWSEEEDEEKHVEQEAEIEGREDEDADEGDTTAGEPEIEGW